MSEHPTGPLLAIDTSTYYAGVALAGEQGVLAERTWYAGINHSQQLLPAIRAMLGEQHIALQDVGLVAVAAGPGSFNGLRVGFATAKGLARSTTQGDRSWRGPCTPAGRTGGAAWSLSRSDRRWR